MKKEDIIQRLKAICNQAYIEDMDPEIFCVIAEKDYQIGSFFIIDDSLYFGETSGDLCYVRIGKTEELQMITYQYFEDDRSVDYVFDFGYYRVSRSHTEYHGVDTISVYDYSTDTRIIDRQSFIDSVKMIEDAIRSIHQQQNSDGNSKTTENDKLQRSCLMNTYDYNELLEPEREYEWLNSLPETRKGVDLLLDYIRDQDSIEACLHFIMWTDILSIDTINALAITDDDIRTVVDKIFKTFDIEFIKLAFKNATSNTIVLKLFQEHGCPIETQ